MRGLPFRTASLPFASTRRSRTPEWPASRTSLPSPRRTSSSSSDAASEPEPTSIYTHVLVLVIITGLFLCMCAFVISFTSTYRVIPWDPAFASAPEEYVKLYVLAAAWLGINAAVYVGSVRAVVVDMRKVMRRLRAEEDRVKEELSWDQMRNVEEGGWMLEKKVGVLVMVEEVEEDEAER